MWARSVPIGGKQGRPPTARMPIALQRPPRNDDVPRPPAAPRSLRGDAARLVLAATVVALTYFAWRLLDVLMLVFGSIVVAVVLRTLSEPLGRRLGGKPRVAQALVVLGALGLAVLVVWLIGDRMADQFKVLRGTLPAAVQAVVRWLNSNAFGLALIEIWQNARGDEGALGRVAGLATMTLGALSSTLLMLAMGIYLAADPSGYRRGLLRLLPPAQRGRVDDALVAAGDGLRRWLLGQGVSMLVIGSLTTGGLLLLGMPLAVSLGVLAGLLAFVPFFGAISAGLLTVLVAFSESPQMALYAALLCLGVQQVEELLVMPRVQRWAVHMPPALALISVVMFGLLFGPLGALFATPLMVVAMILVQRLYVDGVVESPEPPPR